MGICPEPTRRRRFPLGLAGMLALVVAVERGSARLDRATINSWGIDWQQSDRAARRPATRCAILCVGDSMIKFDVLPRVLQARLGRPAYNLGLSAGNPAPTFFVLRHAL